MSQAQAFAEAHGRFVGDEWTPGAENFWRTAMQAEDYRAAFVAVSEIIRGADTWQPDLAGGMTMDELLGMQSEFAPRRKKCAAPTE